GGGGHRPAGEPAIERPRTSRLQLVDLSREWRNRPMKNRRNRSLIAVGVTSLVVAAIGSAYLIGRARAAGVPATQPLIFSGTLTDTAGTPLTGSKNIQVQIWDKATAGNIVCTTGSSAQVLVGGAFSVALPAACVA